MQQLNGWFYKIGVGRIQTRLELPVPVYFLLSEDPSRLFQLKSSTRAAVCSTTDYTLTSHDIQGKQINDNAW